MMINFLQPVAEEKLLLAFFCAPYAEKGSRYDDSYSLSLTGEPGTERSAFWRFRARADLKYP